MNQEILVIPGAFQSSENYRGYQGLDIWQKDFRPKEINSKWVIAHSFGANYLFSQSIDSNLRIILINPLIRKIDFLHLLVLGVKYLFLKEISSNKIINVRHWYHAFKLLFRLSQVNLLEMIQNIPRSHIIIIRGVDDNLFFDSSSVNLIIKKGYEVYTVKAGHNWNSKIAEKVKKIIQNHG